MTKASTTLQFFMLLSKSEAVISRKLSGQGLGFGDLAVLYAIYRAPEGKIRRIDLAEAVGLTASGVTRLLVPLEKIGIIKREAHERDGRVSYALLTRAGKELLENSLSWTEMKCEELLPKNVAKNLDHASELLKSLTI